MKHSVHWLAKVLAIGCDSFDSEPTFEYDLRDLSEAELHELVMLPVKLPSDLRRYLKSDPGFSFDRLAHDAIEDYVERFHGLRPPFGVCFEPANRFHEAQCILVHGVDFL